MANDGNAFRGKYHDELAANAKRIATPGKGAWRLTSCFDLGSQVSDTNHLGVLLQAYSPPTSRRALLASGWACSAAPLAM